MPVEGFFDGKKLMVSKINGTIKNFNFIKDTITANLDISAVERSGFKIKKLQADYKLTPAENGVFKTVDKNKPQYAFQLFCNAISRILLMIWLTTQIKL